MIIQVLASVREEGYLSKGRHPTLGPFFACANVAFRRKALQEIGGFDPLAVTGEDCDACARVSAAGWELYMRRPAIVSHHNPSTLRRLIRQWYGYGRYHPYVFAKHNDRAVEVYARRRQPAAGELYMCLFYRRFPVAMVLFVTRFLMLHLALLGTVLAWVLGWTSIGWAGLVLTSLAGISYAWPDFRRFGPVLGWALLAVRYLADVALFLGAFVGGLKQKMLYLSASVS